MPGKTLAPKGFGSTSSMQPPQPFIHAELAQGRLQESDGLQEVTTLDAGPSSQTLEHPAGGLVAALEIASGRAHPVTAGPQGSGEAVPSSLAIKQAGCVLQSLPGG